MAERKSVNKYYPSDYDPKKTSTINKYRGSHPYGDRGRKWESEGILVVRFEMPWNSYCLSCEQHIGRGVRYNAEKKKSNEKYFTSPIYDFQMKCHLCGNLIQIQTDPKNRDFQIIKGIRKAIVSSPNEDDNDDNDENEDNNEELLKEYENDKNNPIFKLLTKKRDIKVQINSSPSIDELYKFKETHRNDHYAMSSNLRKNFRTLKSQERSEQLINLEKGIVIPLVKENQDDIIFTENLQLPKQSLLKKLNQIQKSQREITINTSNLKKQSTLQSNQKTIEIIKKKENIDSSIFLKSSSHKSNDNINSIFSNSLFK